MSRPLRTEFAGALYHITSRGDRREDIYEDDEDRQSFLTVVAGVCDTLAAYRSGGFTQGAIARYFGLHYSRVSRIIKAVKPKPDLDCEKPQGQKARPDPISVTPLGRAGALYIRR